MQVVRMVSGVYEEDFEQSGTTCVPVYTPTITTLLYRDEVQTVYLVQTM